MKRGLWLLGLLALCLTAGCHPAKADELVWGRWQRVGEPGLGEPDVLLSRYVEFRPHGVLATLLHNDGSGAFWLIGAANSYNFPDRQHIQVSGKCWRGMESFPCTRVYRLTVRGENLRLSEDGMAAHQVEFRRIGPASSELSPTLAPPSPTSTPIR